MMRLLCTAAVTVLTLASFASAEVLYDFESGAQGWGSFGPITTDSGMLPTGGVGGSQGRFHVGDFDVAGWGMVDVSPVVDLTGMDAMSFDGKLNNPVPANPFVGTPEVEFMLAIGYAEWTETVTLTEDYQTFAVDFVDLTPNYYASIAPYFGNLPPLDDPGLQIKMVMRQASGSGVGELDYDNVRVTPEPTSLALLALGIAALIRRRG